MVTVIGGAGRMGHWFARFLKANGYSVIIADKNKQTAMTLCKKYGFQFLADQVAAARQARVVIVATPTNVTSAVLQKLAHKLKPETLVVEISSIKAPVSHAIRKLQNDGIAVLSIHPMFGASVTSLRGRCILAVTTPQNREAKRILSIFQKNGARIIHCTLRKHDALASAIITLPHFMNISLIETLRSLGVNLNELSSVAGTTFQLQLLLAEAIYNEDFGNEISILRDSKRTVLEAYIKQTATVLEMVNTRPARLTRLLGVGRELVKTHRQFASSYGRFNAAVQASLT
jgi:prephenate dehydrogenase